MTKITFIIQLPGVMLRIPAVWESKHCSEESVHAAGDRLATALGGTYLYFEEPEWN
jgi:hypothetical protein